jgi:predicted DCC family thiol-disulfide oxidoreductase YuxK
LLHIGIGTTTNLKQFQSTMMAFPLLLLGPADFAALAARHLARRGRLLVVFDGDCGVCMATVRLLKRLDPLAQLRFVASHDSDVPADLPKELLARTIVVRELERGRQFTRAAAFARILRALPGWRPLGWILAAPGIVHVAGWCYDRFAARRTQISTAFGWAACGVASPNPPAAAMSAGGAVRPRPGRRAGNALAQLTIGFLLAVAVSQLILENRALSRMLPLRQPDLFAAVVQYGRLFQGWGMFAPDAPVDDGVLVIDATTIDGRHIDPLTGEPPQFLVAPPHGHYPMQQNWCDYSNRIRLPGNSAYRANLRDYLLRRWQLDGRPASERPVSFDVYWVSTHSPAPGDHATPLIVSDRVFSYP